MRTIGSLLRERFRDFWVELAQLEESLTQNPSQDGIGEMRARIRALRAVLMDENPDLEPNADVLTSYWNWCAENGIVPNLELTDDSPEVVAWAESRRR